MPTMNYKRFFATQREFDKKFQQVPKDERILKKFVALSSEVGETLNEKPSVFKYWSKKQLPAAHKNAEVYATVYQAEPIYPEVDMREIILNEISDCWHYILSLGNELGVSEQAIPMLEKYGPVDSEKSEARLFMDFSARCAEVYNTWIMFVDMKNKDTHFKMDPIHSPNMLLSSYILFVYNFMQIVGKLGYSSEEFENAYYEKNGINLERQVNGY